MRLIGFGFIAGFAFALLALISIDARSDDSATAAGTWQSKQFLPPIAHSSSEQPDPDRYFSDWLTTMPASCSIAPVYVSNYDPTSASPLPLLNLIDVYYACP